MQWRLAWRGSMGCWHTIEVASSSQLSWCETIAHSPIGIGTPLRRRGAGDGSTSAGSARGKQEAFVTSSSSSSIGSGGCRRRCHRPSCMPQRAALREPRQAPAIGCACVRARASKRAHFYCAPLKRGDCALVMATRQRPAMPPARQAVRMKVISFGSEAVGKSCLIKRYCEEKFVSKYISTIGVDFGVRIACLPAARGSEPSLRSSLCSLSCR